MQTPRSPSTNGRASPTRGALPPGTGPTSASGGNPGPSCDSVVSEVPSERSIFTLNSAIAGVSEGNFGRLGADQQGVYVTGNARSQLDPSLWEMPGAMPEIVPGGDFGANIDRLFTERSMVMQAWGAYGVLWPVIHQWLGVSPELGRGGSRWCRSCRPGRQRHRPTRSSWACSPSMWLQHTKARRTPPRSPGTAGWTCASVPFCRTGLRSPRRRSTGHR